MKREGRAPVTAGSAIFVVGPAGRAQGVGMKNDDDFDKHPAKLLAEDYFRQKKEINRKYRGQARKARLMIADLTYGLGLIEGNLGIESVRDNWRKHIDRMWTCNRSEETIAREHLLMAIDWAARCYVEPRPASRWKKPRATEQRYFGTDRNGVKLYWSAGFPHADEAAEEGIAFLASFDPELAGRVGVADIAPLVEVWLDRKTNVGRRGKTQRVDEALCALVRQLGFGKVEPEAMRRQRTQFEKKSLMPPVTRASAG